MNTNDDTVWLSRYILKDMKFRRVVYYPDSSLGDYSIIGKVKDVEEKRFLGLFKYKSYKYFYVFEVVECENTIRVVKKYFDMFLSDFKNTVKEFEKLTNYNVKVKAVDNLFYFSD